MDTPILFIIFNRPKSTQIVFEAIRQAKPKRLFIAADGPRDTKIGEKELCDQARKVVEYIDWDCEVKTLFREKNLGCGRAVSSAITWFFEYVSEGIILEDDCLPDSTFFEFCKELLKTYRTDDRVFMISGGNYIPKSLRPNQSYYFSKLPHIWGWATWKRSWDKYNFTMNDFPTFKNEKSIANVWTDTNTQNYFLERLEEVYKGKLDTWDYQWNYCIWKNEGLSITPTVNLVSNIGFGDDATHTLNKNDASANLVLEKMNFPLTSVPFELYTEGDNYENLQVIKRDLVLKKVLKKIGLFKIVKYFYIVIKNKF